MHPITERQLLINRRQFFGRLATGIGTAALGSLLSKDLLASPAASALERGLPHLPHHAPKAKRVIYMLMSGGPPHMDMYDYKPHLAEMRGKELPPSVQKGQRLST